MSNDSTDSGSVGGYLDDHGLLWRAKAGATSTFEENVAARALFMDLHQDQFWNPWRMEDQADELAKAMQVMDEWKRAEPGFRRKTKRQLDAEMARRDREFEREQAERQRQRQENAGRYDAEREANRLALLEQESATASAMRHLAEMRSGEAFPGMDPTRRAENVAELEAALSKREQEAARLVPLVGDRRTL